MGKVRAKTLGDEELEQKEREEAEKRRLAKIEAAKTEGRTAKAMAKSEEQSAEDTSVEEKVESSVILNDNEEPSFDSAQDKKDSSQVYSEQSRTAQDDNAPQKKVVKKDDTTAHNRSARYKEAVKLVEKSKAYSLSQALELLGKVHLATFDETVELHINTFGSVSGSMNLPHGTGKSTRVAILAPSKDAAAADALLKEIEAGKITFDVLVATPDAMPRLAKVARVLGPKGLMPNPKNGTVTPNPEAVAKQYEGGHMTFKTEAKAPVLHLSVGKLSFGKDKLEENITVAFKAVESKNIKKVTLKSTMSPAIRISL